MSDETQTFGQLSFDQSWDLLESHEFGRLAFHLADEVHIAPVNYAADDRKRLVFRTSEGSKLFGVTVNADVAFEIDEISDDVATSVIVRGRARQLHGYDAEITEQLPLRPWVGTDKSNIMAIDVDEITGRRFHLTRPWQQMRPEHG